MLEQLKQTRRNRTRRGAFSLVELLLVMVILGVLAGVVVPKFLDRRKDADISKAVQQIDAFKSALRMYAVDNQGNFPSESEGLSALVGSPQDNRRSYLETNEVPPDPWGRPYIYRNPGQKSNAGYDLFSLGADGVESGDDITNWQNR